VYTTEEEEENMLIIETNKKNKIKPHLLGKIDSFSLHLFLALSYFFIRLSVYLAGNKPRSQSHLRFSPHFARRLIRN
jgi:hypothetical protein